MPEALRPLFNCGEIYKVKRYTERARDVFRQDIGTTVRSVSPFLIASDGLLLDDVIETIEPGYGWLAKSPPVRIDLGSGPIDVSVAI